MTLIISDKPTAQEVAPSGLQPAVCVDAIDIGEQDSPWGPKEKVIIVWELEATDSRGERFLLQKRYTKSLHKKSNLRQDLERWRGREFKPEELQQGFNLKKVVGVTAMLHVQHKETERGTWANIDSVMPAPEVQLQPSGNYQRTTIAGES